MRTIMQSYSLYYVRGTSMTIQRKLVDGIFTRIYNFSIIYQFTNFEKFQQFSHLPIFPVILTPLYHIAKLSFNFN